MVNTFSGDFQTSAAQIVGSHITAASLHFDSSPAPIQDKKKRLLDALKFDQINHRRTSIRQAHQETCEWLLFEHHYVTWNHGHNSDNYKCFLCIKGKPGSGKSTLMGYAFRDARKKSKGTSTAVASFFFNRWGPELAKTTAGMYRSLLAQILKHEDLVFIANQMDEAGLDIEEVLESPSWTVESLETLFKEVISHRQRPITCFIDALDECNEDQIRSMVSSLQHLGYNTDQHPLPFKVCFSSRHYPRISIKMAQELVLDRQMGHNEDISRYIESELSIDSKDVHEEIKAELRQRACGIFMWVALMVDLLNKESDRGGTAFQQVLRDVPKDVFDLFREVLATNGKSSNQTLLCLQLLLLSRKPIKLYELYVAMLSGINPAASIPDKLRVDEVEKFILFSSRGLAEITKERSTVRFIHESVRDFLINDNGLRDLWQGHEANTAVSHHTSQQDFLRSSDLAKWTHLDDSFCSVFSRHHNAPASVLYNMAEMDIHRLVNFCPRNNACLKPRAERCGALLNVASARGSAGFVRVLHKDGASVMIPPSVPSKRSHALAFPSANPAISISCASSHEALHSMQPSEEREAHDLTTSWMAPSMTQSSET